MTPEQVLERRYRRLLACYPPAYRAAYGEEMLAVALAAARPGRRWPDPVEAADLILSGIRRRLGTLRAGCQQPAWCDAAGVVAIIGPVLMAAFAARGLLTPISRDPYGWHYPGPVPVGGIIVAAAWAGVATLAMLGRRQLALAGSWALLAWLIGDFALRTTGSSYGDSYQFGAGWWQIVFAVVIAASALLAVKNPPRRVTWPATTAVAFTALLLAMLPVITAATLTPPLPPSLYPSSPAWRAWNSDLSTMMNVQAWLNDALPAALLIVLLVVIARLRRDVRLRVFIALMPVVAAALLDTWGYGGILGDEYPLVVYPSHVAGPQWLAALTAAPVLCFVAGLTCLSWFERRGAAGVPG